MEGARRLSALLRGEQVRPLRQVLGLQLVQRNTSSHPRPARRIRSGRGMVGEDDCRKGTPLPRRWPGPCRAPVAWPAGTPLVLRNSGAGHDRRSAWPVSHIRSRAARCGPACARCRCCQAYRQVNDDAGGEDDGTQRPSAQPTAASSEEQATAARRQDAPDGGRRMASVLACSPRDLPRRRISTARAPAPSR